MPPTNMASGPKGTRSSAPRTQTGCKNCRKRRIKCDETKPACERCVRSGWKCDGYPADIVLKASANNRNTSNLSLLSRLPSIASYSIPFKVPGSQTDRQLLHYFCVQGSNDIAGFLTSDFWSQTVLQESHQDPTVRQALVALSWLHLDYSTSECVGNSVTRADALTQYGKALRSMRKRLSRPSESATKIALICCILFYCCEGALGDRNAALQHLSNGLNLLISTQHEHNGVVSQDIQNLSDVFERLDMQASFFEDDRTPILVLPSWQPSGEKDYTLLLEDTFTGLQKAQQSLVRLQAWLYHFVNKNADHHNEPKESLPVDILQEKDALMKGYTSWIIAINNYEKETECDNETLHGIRTLLVHFHVCRMIVESKFPNDPEVFGASPNPAAHKILDLAETLLQYTTLLNGSPNATKSPRRNFSLETGVVAPLFALAIKCSDESVATRAAQMLASSQRREGLYDSQTMAQIVTLLKDTRDVGMGIKQEESSESAPLSALEYHLPDSYSGGGIDKLLSSMDLSRLMI
ncbi:Ff.00g015140.m01.CDS01 [Fusarium sp. VM40]|nr:Ff.00g015140.m01.CDS01 [Fusarium sp. VM40]